MAMEKLLLYEALQIVIHLLTDFKVSLELVRDFEITLTQSLVHEFRFVHKLHE